MVMKVKPSLLFVILGAIVAFALSSCVPLAAGAAGGYILAEEGVEVRSPITTQ